MPSIDVPVFSGQGTLAVNSVQTRERALHHATSPAGSLLLSSCFDAFHVELSSLPPSELHATGIEPSDFMTPQSLLAVPQERYLLNPVISGTVLFLIQTLSYLDHVESQTHPSSFASALEKNRAHGLGVLGFSSGILPACVVGTSASKLEYLTNAVSAFKVAFWIGVRSQLYRQSSLQAAGMPADDARPWSLVFLGMGRVAAEEGISQFSQSNEISSSIHVTAVTDDTCVTISGRPDVLASFAASLPASIPVHKTSVDTLYHSPLHTEGMRADVLADLTRRDIRFPTFSGIQTPIRSTFTGALLAKDGDGSLVETVVDMVLTQPVNWDKVVASLIQATPDDQTARLINVGPGAGLTRGMERAFPLRNVFSVDLTALDKKSGAELHVPAQEPIAIVGMSVNLPGAPDISKLWDVLEQGINTIAEIPDQRFKVSDYTTAKTGRSMKAHTGNFIDDADGFDNKFFKISPREARSMDPQARVLLHTAYEAMEDAGYVPNATATFAPENIGCYVGAATGDYIQNLRNDVDVYYSTGTLRAFLSGRISYAMQLGGPSVVIDTACSSSLVAIYQACRALMNGDCNAAMAGGVNIVTSPDMFLGLDRGHFLSPTGQCKAFDASADGYSRSEGCGIFVLKRLSDALAENDNVLGVIRGVEVNQSGLAHSITHPHPPTQVNLFNRILERSGIDASRVNVVEAHGTGTQAGDPNELESIRGVFAVRRSVKNPLHITSVKANIGHAEAASGAAGLAKLLLMLQHRKIPRLISLKNLNPRIVDLTSDHTIIDTEHTTWHPSDEGLTRVALLNNFGAAGSNGALLLEEFVPPLSDGLGSPAPSSYTVGLSAKTPEALTALRTRYIDWLNGPESNCITLQDIAYTATARRRIYDHRLAVSASNTQELAEKLKSASALAVPNIVGKVAFVFSGQGGQYLGMGSTLYKTVPLFREIVDECHAFLTASGFPGVVQIIAPEGIESGLSQLEEFEANQAAIFALEYALAKVWMSWGIMPEVVVGHSLGEYAAQVIAGVLTLKGALTLIANRVRFMVQKCPVDTTGMIAVNLGPDAIQTVMQATSAFPDASVACLNSLSDCVVSGPLDQLRTLKAHLDAEVHCKNVLLTVPFGYHSPAMRPFLDDLTVVAQHVTIRPPTIPIISNTSGEVVLPGDGSVFNADYYSRHCAEPVQFEKGVSALFRCTEVGSISAWIEIGPHTTTLPMIKVHPAVPKDAMLLGSIRKGHDPWTTLSTTLAQLYTSPIDLQWRKVFEHLPSVTCAHLPSYPWNKSKFWVAFKEDSVASGVEAAPAPTTVVSLVAEYSMLHAWAQFPSAENGRVAVFETPISQLAKSISGHSVGDHPLCPASVYHELALAGVKASSAHLRLTFKDTFVVLRDVDYAKPLVYNAEVPRIVKTSITLDPEGSGSWKVASTVGSAAEDVHSFGTFKFVSTSKTTTKFSRVLPVVGRQIAAVSAGKNTETFSTRTAYEVIFPRVVDYAKEYHTMKTLTVSADGMEGYAVIQLPLDHDRGLFVVHPVFMDTMLHVAGFVANMQGGLNDAFICSKVESVKAIPELIDNDLQYGVYISNAWVPEEGVMLADAHAVEINGSGRIVAYLKGMHFRKVRLSSLKRGLAMASAGSAGVRPAPQRTQVSTTSPTVSRTASVSPLPSLAPSRPPIQPTVDVQAEVARIVAETCDAALSSLDINADLETFGVDSLMSIEIFGKLQNAFPNADLDANVLSSCHSVVGITKEVSSKLSFDSSGPSSPSTLIVQEDRLPDAGATFSLDQDINVKPLLASALGLEVHELTDDADFDSLGLDSLTSIEAHHALQNAYMLELPEDLFISHTTAKALQAFISAQLHSRSKKADVKAAVIEKSPVHSGKMRTKDIDRLVTALNLDTVPISIQVADTPGRAPLFLVHDGSGLINYITRLSRQERDLWGIHNPHFINSQPWDSVVSMAAEYAGYAVKTSSGPLLVGGWSMGGVVAFEAARQLLKKGVAIKGVVLIDSPCPLNHVPLSDALIDSVARLDGRNTVSDVAQLVKRQFQMNSRMLGTYNPLAGGGPYPPLVLLRSSEGFKPSGVSDVPQWLADRSDPRPAIEGWESVVGASVKAIDIPGNHFQPFHTSNIGSVSRAIADACSYLESLPQ